MPFNAFRENKIPAKISEFTVINAAPPILIVSASGSTSGIAALSSRMVVR